MTFFSAQIPTRHALVHGQRIAWRELGSGSAPPLVLVNRFRGTMDEWDPLLLDALAAQRRVVLFDNVGVARSEGVAPPRLTGWADNAVALLDALGIGQADLLGFSFGGLVAQEIAHRHPQRIRRLIIAASGAGYVENATLRPEALQVATRPVNTEQDFLFLFFRDTPPSQAAGRAHLARLRERTDAFEKLVSAEAWQAMLSAGSDVSTPETSLLRRAPSLRKPVLVANGVEDIMIPTIQSYALQQALPEAKLILYPDSGHGFLFQHAREFALDAARFLDAPAAGDSP